MRLGTWRRSDKRLTRLVVAAALLLTTFVVTGAGGQAHAARPFGTGVGTKADSGAVVWSEKWWDDRTVDVMIWSPAMNAYMPVRLLLPPGWSYDAQQTWPLLLMLHGGNDNFLSWTRETDIEQRTANRGVIVALPEAGPGATYTDYYNAGKGGPPRWETFHTEELLQILERGYRANQTRAVAGISAGGYGAMAYAARNPGMFRYAASYSGFVVLTLPMYRTLTTILQSLIDQDPFARLGDPIRDEENWRAHDPYRLAENFRGTGVYLSNGMTGLPAEYDTVEWAPVQLAEAVTYQMSQALAMELMRNGTVPTTHFYALGEHAWASWQRELDRSWPLIMGAIGA
jgi:diacylglycerol O-acyltransferase/trehalose O-mycolyltransferase